MKKIGMYKRMIAIGIIASMIVIAGCSNRENTSSSAGGQSSLNTSSSSNSSLSSSNTNSLSTEEKAKATLYIGMDETFQEYPLEYTGELTPEALIEGIADLTGWDLTLADSVTTGKGGMTVCFAKTSALFVGPPDPQKDEFHMFSVEQLDQTILDSIKKTLQNNFVDSSLGDPDSLPIYYCMEGEQPLTLPNVNVTIPMDQPYESFPALQ